MKIEENKNPPYPMSAHCSNGNPLCGGTFQQWKVNSKKKHLQAVLVAATCCCLCRADRALMGAEKESFYYFPH